MSELRAEFFVQGTPIPKARPRVVRGKGAFPITYTPKTTREWESLIAIEYQRQCKGVFFDKPVAIKFYAEIVCPGVGSPSTIRGDIDNHCKSILDALNLFAFADDSQITHMHVVKRRARKGEKTGAYILIEPVGAIQPELIGGFNERQRRQEMSEAQTEL